MRDMVLGDLFVKGAPVPLRYFEFRDPESGIIAHLSVVTGMS